MQLFYILGEFPSTTEYFVLQELIELKQKGLGIKILALNRSEYTAYNKKIIDPLLSETVFYKTLSFITIAAPVYCLLRYFKSSIKEYAAITRHFFNSPKDALKKTRDLFIANHFIYVTRKQDQKHFHAHFASQPSTVAYSIHRLTGFSYSISAHAHDIYTKNELLPGKIENAKFVVTCTKANQVFLAGNAANKPIFHVYHGIKISMWPFKKRNKIDQSQTIKILTVARLIEKKGIIYLLKALSSLQEEFNFECTIVGEGIERSSLESYCRAAGITDKIVFTGSLPQEKLLPFYHSHDVFILPSFVAGDGDRDGLPNVLLESLATGIPVITTGVSAIPELICHKESGILIAEKNEQEIAFAIRELITNSTLYEHISTKGRNRVQEKFNIENSTNQLLSLFNQLELC